MNYNKYSKSIFPLFNSENKNYGASFLIHKDGQFSYLLTCTHVIDDLGDISKIKVNNSEKACEIYTPVTGYDRSDLTILKIRDLLTYPTLSLGVYSHQKAEVTICALERESGNEDKYTIHYIEGVRNTRHDIKSTTHDTIDKAWTISNLTYKLWPGCSGSPVISNNTGDVIGIIYKRRKDGFEGAAISIEELKYIWPEKQHLVSKYSPSSFFITRRNTDTFRARIQSASKSIDVSGFTLNSLLNDVAYLKEQLRNCKLEIRLLAMDPNGKAIEQIYKRYTSKIREEFYNNSDNVTEEDLLEGMRKLIRKRLDNLVDELFFVSITDRLLEEVKQYIDSDRLTKLEILKNVKPGYHDKTTIVEVIGEESWARCESCFIKNRILFEIKVVDQRLPTGYFIIDKDEDCGIMHAEIELDYNTKASKLDTPLFVLHKYYDEEWYNNFIANYTSLWDDYSTYYFPACNSDNNT